MENLVNRNLVIYFDNGTNDNGKELTKTKTFRNARFEAADENLSEFAQLYAALSSRAHVKTLVAEYRQL